METAAKALVAIDPLLLLSEHVPPAEAALAEFSVQTGTLVFDDHLITGRGERQPPMSGQMKASAIAGELVRVYVIIPLKKEQRAILLERNRAGAEKHWSRGNLLDLTASAK